MYYSSWILSRSNPLLNRFIKEYFSSFLYNLAFLKDFIKNIAYSINSIKDNPIAVLDTVS